MELIDDPEIIEDFCKEAAGLFDELEEILEDLEEELDKADLRPRLVDGREEGEQIGLLLLVELIDVVCVLMTVDRL